MGTNNTIDTSHTIKNDEEDGNIEGTWVRNMSSTPPDQGTNKGPIAWTIFALVPQCPPVGESMASMEQVCTQLKQGEAEDLRGEISPS